MQNNIINIVAEGTGKINLFPDSVIEEIAQNIRVILTTPKGSVPLDRGFGIDCSFIDDPLPRAVMKAAVFISESIQEFEKRVEVKEIDFIQSEELALDGRMIPRVKVRVLDEFL